MNVWASAVSLINVKNISLKLTVRATVLDLKPYICKRNGTQIHLTALCWLKQLVSPKLNSLLLRLQT